VTRITTSHGPEHIRLPEGWRHLHVDELDSTNTALKRMVEMGTEAAEGMIVSARIQTAGRGRDGRAWSSPPGNLYASILVEPPEQISRAPEISFVAALGVIAAIQSLVPDRASDEAVRAKWPNDILFEGAKVAGILLETAQAPDAAKPCVVLGIGLNLEPVAIAPAVYPVTSLLDYGHRVSPTQALEAVAKHLALQLGLWRREGFAATREAWMARAAGLGGAVTVRLPQESMTGRLVGIDADGAALVDDEGGTRRRIVAGDILLRA